jgi:nucleoside-diphosphate-sugar epimerase
VASRVLVLGLSGLIGSHLGKSDVEVEYIRSNSRCELRDLNSIELIISEARELMCDSLLHLAWESNSSIDYDRRSSHHDWANYSSVLIHRAIEQKIKVYATGTGLENDKFFAISEYLIAKKKLHADIQLEISKGNVTWLQPYFILSRLFHRPRILAEYLKDPSNFEPQQPMSRHDYIFVEDVGFAIDKIIERQIQGVVEIGAGVLRTNLELINSLRLHDHYYSLPTVAKPIFYSFPENRPADTTKLSDIGWVPEKTSTFFDFETKRE